MMNEVSTMIDVSMMRLQKFVPLLIVVGLCAGTASAQLPVIPSSFSRTVDLPVVGLASSETAQVNVVNLAPSAQPVITAGISASGGATASCAGSIAFYNGSGSAIGSSTSFTIGTGQIFSATLAYSDTSSTATAASGRTAVRAVVTVTESGSPCAPSANMETFDTTTGVTHVHVEGSSQVILSGVFALTEPTPGAQR
jgi:hypothetical protein